MPKPLAKYIGGKQRLAFQIVQLMPPHETYIEGFAGMASVYLSKPKSKINIVNDINDSIVNLFRVARDYAPEFVKMIELTPYAQKQYEAWFDLYFNRKEEFYKLSSLKRALVFYYILQCAYNSQYVTHKNLDTFSTTTAKMWGSRSMLENIADFSKWTQGTAFTNMDYRKLVEKYGDAKTLVYLDPPYTMAEEKGYYEHNFQPDDHSAMRDFVERVAKEKGVKFIISYDDSDNIKSLFSPEKGFFHSIIKDVAQASSNADESGQRVTKNELIITTFNPNFLGLFYAQ